MTIRSFIRFADESGKIHYGAPKEIATETLTGSAVDILSGDPFTGLSLTGEIAVIKKASL